MCVIAMHYPSGVLTERFTGDGLLRQRIEEAGYDAGDWVVLLVRCTYNITGYVGPENDRKWRQEHGVEEIPAGPVPIYSDDCPVGVDRV